jgi:hypothetical protein
LSYLDRPETRGWTIKLLSRINCQNPRLPSSVHRGSSNAKSGLSRIWSFDILEG